MEAKREFHLLNWLLSAFNLLAGTVRLPGLPTRVSCPTEALRQMSKVREVSALVCTAGRSALPYFFGVMGAVEGSGANQLAIETEQAS